MSTQLSLFQTPRNNRVYKKDLPQVPLHIRMKQVWILVWFESNQYLQIKHHFNRNFLNSLSGIFNTTITYRNDSWTSNHFYSGGFIFEKNSKSIYPDDEWQNYEEQVFQKNK